MRFIIDTIVVLMLAGIVAGFYFHYRSERQMEDRIELARKELTRFTQEIMLRGTLGEVPLNSRGAPQTVKPEWFGRLPTNPLLGPGHPWLEIAGPSEASLAHPPNRTASDHSVAQFWYNPNLGVLRARVPAGIADASALKLYNRVNDRSLSSLFLSAKTP